MGSNDRLNEIGYLINTALDSEEEYLYEGEMSSYVRSYAVDAAMELSWLFRGSAPTTEEIDFCMKALSDSERIKRGRSKELLLRLRERSRPFIEALADSPDPQLRIFALETGRTSLNPYFPDPLYGSIELNRRLMDDPDENVRAVAVSTVQQTIVHNAAYLKASLPRGVSNTMLDLLSRILARLDDPSPRVRAEAANVLLLWAAEFGQETLELFLERENNPAAWEILANTKAPNDPTTKDDHP